MRVVSKKYIFYLQVYIFFASLLFILIWDRGTTSKAADAASFDIPVSVVLSADSNIPAAGTTYTFKLETLNSAPLPSTTTLALASPTATGEANKTTGEFHISTSQSGNFIYKLSETSSSRTGNTMDTGFWTIYVSVSADGSVSSMTWSYTEGHSNITADSFNIVKQYPSGTYPTAASVTTSGDSISLKLGGDSVIASQSSESALEFNTAVIESKFAIDFTKSFEVSGRFTGASSPDGSYVGFIPSVNTLPTSSELKQGGFMAIYGTTFAKNAILLEFDSYDNGSNMGDTGIGGKHFALMQSDASGNVSVVNNQYKTYNTWPTGEGSYSITNNATSHVLTIKYIASDNSTATWTYSNPTSKLGTTAKLILGGSIRRAGATYVGAVGSLAPKTEMVFDIFGYTGSREGYSTDGVFVNKYSCPHTDWEYTLSGKTIKAKCISCNGDCPTYPDAIEIALNPNSNATVNGDNIKWTTIQSASFLIDDATNRAKWLQAFGENSLPEIKYVGTGSTNYEESTIPPTLAGSYKASISKGGVTAEVPFTIIQVYHISYNNNGGTGTMNSIYTENQNYTLPLTSSFTPPRNKEFIGWALTSDGTKISTSYVNISSDVTLYAVWKKHEHSLKNTTTGNGMTKVSCDCGFYYIKFD